MSGQRRREGAAEKRFRNHTNYPELTINTWPNEILELLFFLPSPRNHHKPGCAPSSTDHLCFAALFPFFLAIIPYSEEPRRCHFQFLFAVLSDIKDSSFRPPSRASTTQATKIKINTPSLQPRKNKPNHSPLPTSAQLCSQIRFPPP